MISWKVRYDGIHTCNYRYKVFNEKDNLLYATRMSICKISSSISHKVISLHEANHNHNRVQLLYWFILDSQHKEPVMQRVCPCCDGGFPAQWASYAKSVSMSWWWIPSTMSQLCKECVHVVMVDSQHNEPVMQRVCPCRDGGFPAQWASYAKSVSMSWWWIPSTMSQLCKECVHVVMVDSQHNEPVMQRVCPCRDGGFPAQWASYAKSVSISWWWIPSTMSQLCKECVHVVM